MPVVEARAELIFNPVSNAGTHHAAAWLQYAEAEYGNSVTRMHGPMAFDWPRGHAHFALLHLTPNGPVR